MMLTMITLLLFIQFTTACVNWTILDPPIIFGETARLSCIIESKSGNSSTRTWFGGQDFGVLSINGISSNPAKYREILQWKGGEFESILEIKDFQEQDVNCDYSCSTGHQETRKKMLLTMDLFELHPRESDVHVFSVLRQGYLDVLLKIQKVYPIPKCKIFFNGHVISKGFNNDVRKTGIFYIFTKHLEHQFPSAICNGKLQIECKVGKTNRQIHQSTLAFCTEKIVKEGSNQENYKMIVSILLVGILCLVAFIGVLSYVRYGTCKKLKNLMQCNVSGEESHQFLELKSTRNQHEKS